MPFDASRRAFLSNYAGSLGGLALAHLFAHPAKAEAVAPKPRAKSVICLFQHGGPSQVDLFDRKPELTRWHGQPYPGKVEAHFDKQQGACLASPFRFIRHGQCGMELTELLPRIGGLADEITLVRSMATESVDHEAALRLIHTGKLQAGRPTWGSWVIYALGSESEDLPAYVVLGDPGGLPVDGTRNWSSGWLPAIYQGTTFRSGGSPVLNLTRPERVSASERQRQLACLEGLNRLHLARHPENNELAARIKNFETASRMQVAVPRIMDLTNESAETRRLYGLDTAETAEYGARCLMARRLVEQGVRFVQVFMSGQPWDTHSNNAESLRGLCRRVDQPSAALVHDLKRRGLLDETIVLWTGEFGRLPISQGPDGRDHNRHAFSLWLAGGGFKSGYVHGATDEFGYKSVQDVVRVFDLQATLFAALGLDHESVTYPHDGRDESLTDAEVTGAKPVEALLA